MSKRAGEFERRQRAVIAGVDVDVIENKLHGANLSFFDKLKMEEVWPLLIRAGEFLDTKERLFLAVECGAWMAGGSQHEHV